MTRRPLKSDQRGSAVLVLLVVLLAMGAIAAALILPSVLQDLSARRGSEAGSELQTIYLAIVGDQATTFGYYGDVGAYPASLMDLVRDPAPPTAGWKGPYLNVPAGSIVGGQLVDSYGNPFEYYLVDRDIIRTEGNPDRLVIISRGPDGLSTNTSSTPNTASTFTGMVPTNNTYLSQTGNSDNAAFPSLDSAYNVGLLKRFVLGTFEATIRNFDSNAAVNAYVDACPNLYTMTLTSASRGSADVRTENVGQVTSSVTPIDLQLGAWQVNITSPLASTALFSQTITILPNATATRTINLAGLNSAGTATFTLAINNQYKTATNDLDVYISGVKNATTAVNNATTNYTVPGCAPIQLNKKGTTTVIDAFTMPYGISTFTKIEGVTTRQVNVANGSTGPEVRVYDNGNNTVTGIQIGQVALKKEQSFSVTLGDYITVKDNSGATLETVLINATKNLKY